MRGKNTNTVCFILIYSHIVLVLDFQARLCFLLWQYRLQLTVSDTVNSPEIYWKLKPQRSNNIFWLELSWKMSNFWDLITLKKKIFLWNYLVWSKICFYFKLQIFVAMTWTGPPLQFPGRNSVTTLIRIRWAFTRPGSSVNLRVETSCLSIQETSKSLLQNGYCIHDCFYNLWSGVCKQDCLCNFPYAGLDCLVLLKQKPLV